MPRTFTAHSPLGEQLRFRSLSGREALSGLFEFRVRLLGESPSISAKTLLGQDLSVEVDLTTEKDGGGKRFLSGQVVQFAYAGKDGDFYAYEAVLRPWLWLATRRSDFKIFQFKTVPDIIQEVLGPYGFGVVNKLSGSYREWDYCVQYNETDLNFVSRLMESEGIYYFFEHAQGSHKLVLCDGIGSHKPVEGGPSRVPYYPGDRAAHVHDEDFIDGWRFAEDIASGHFASDDYDFTKPKALLDALQQQPAGHSRDHYELYHWPGGYTDMGDGENYARVRIEQQKAARETMQGEGNTRRLAPGYLFDLALYPRGDQNKQYLIEAVSYHFEENVRRSDGAGGGAGGGGGKGGSGGADSPTRYRLSFAVVPSSVDYRSQRSTPKPNTTGPQTAVVVGPPGEEIYTDEYGRVKVQFHWDRYGTMNENSSCWIRVSSPWAGANYGGIYIPRIGQEVIEDFLNGDPDYPIITGRVYNAMQMPPWELPKHKTQSGVKTNWSKGGGGKSMLRFEDQKGIEHLELSNDYGNTHLHMGYLMNQGTEAKRSYGFELRTNEWGAVRADKGLLLTTYTSDFKNKIAHDSPDGFAEMGGMLEHTEGMMKDAEQAISTAKSLIGTLKDGRSQNLASVLSAIGGALGIGGGNETGMPAIGDPAMPQSKQLLADSKKIDSPIVSIVSPAGQSLISPKPIVISSGQSVSAHAKSDITLSSGAQLTQLVKAGMFTHVNNGGQATVVSSGDIAHTATTGAMNLISKENNSLTSTAANAHIEGKNNVLINADTEGVKITAPKRIELICGATMIVMDGVNGTISFQAPNRISTQSTAADIYMKSALQFTAESVTGLLNFSGVLTHIGSDIHLNPDKS